MTMAMRPHARAIRKIIAHIPDAWVREWGNGTISAGRHTDVIGKGMRDVRAALEAAGYRCEANGTPGTEGQFILDVFPPKESST